MTNEHPIPFTTEMVRAVLAGRKSETRRLVKSPDRMRNWKVRDRLWVREAWGRLDNYERNIVFRADGDDDRESLEGHRWRPGFHLFKKDARLWLEITDLHVEPLRDITLEGVIAEGWPGLGKANPIEAVWWHDLWNRLHPDPPYRMEDNPEVRVVGFRILEKGRG